MELQIACAECNMISFMGTANTLEDKETQTIQYITHILI